MRKLAFLLAYGLSCNAQTDPVPRSFAGAPSFELASIKPSPPPNVNITKVGCSGGPGSADPIMILCENMPLSALVMKAYGMQPYQLSEKTPSWLMSPFDMVAKVPPNTSGEQVLVMWRNLLAERFKLTVHHENKDVPVYALVIAKGESKLIGVTTDGPMPAGHGPGTKSRGVLAPAKGCDRHVSSDDMEIASLVHGLSVSLQRPVINDTGLTGRYKIELQWLKEDASTSDPESFFCPTIFEAVKEQLGLQLEPRKRQIEILVIDHAEKMPTEN
jgi:uncharacterized protein (TIGR03435 family)